MTKMSLKLISKHEFTIKCFKHALMFEYLRILTYKVFPKHEFRNILVNMFLLMNLLMKIISNYDCAKFSKCLSLKIILACFSLYLKYSKIYSNPSGEIFLCIEVI